MSRQYPNQTKKQQSQSSQRKYPNLKQFEFLNNSTFTPLTEFSTNSSRSRDQNKSDPRIYVSGVKNEELEPVQKDTTSSFFDFLKLHKLLFKSEEKAQANSSIGSVAYKIKQGEEKSSTKDLVFGSSYDKKITYYAKPAEPVMRKIQDKIEELPEIQTVEQVQLKEISLQQIKKQEKQRLKLEKKQKERLKKQQNERIRRQKERQMAQRLEQQRIEIERVRIQRQRQIQIQHQRKKQVKKMKQRFQKERQQQLQKLKQKQMKEQLRRQQLRKQIQKQKEKAKQIEKEKKWLQKVEIQRKKQKQLEAQRQRLRIIKEQQALKQKQHEQKRKKQQQIRKIRQQKHEIQRQNLLKKKREIQQIKKQILEDIEQQKRIAQQRQQQEIRKQHRKFKKAQKQNQQQIKQVLSQQPIKSQQIIIEQPTIPIIKIIQPSISQQQQQPSTSTSTSTLQFQSSSSSSSSGTPIITSSPSSPTAQLIQQSNQPLIVPPLQIQSQIITQTGVIIPSTTIIHVQPSLPQTRTQTQTSNNIHLQQQQKSIRKSIQFIGRQFILQVPRFLVQQKNQLQQTQAYKQLRQNIQEQYRQYILPVRKLYADLPKRMTEIKYQIIQGYTFNQRIIVLNALAAIIAAGTLRIHRGNPGRGVLRMFRNIGFGYLLGAAVITPEMYYKRMKDKINVDEI